MTVRIILRILVFALTTTPCLADQFNASVSSGYEKITSPLVRIDLDSPLILVEGRTKLAGHYYQLNLSGVKSWDFSGDTGLDLSANVYAKNAPKAEDLNFGSLSTDATWRKKFGNLNFAIGPSLQRILVANKTFRDSAALQSDLTYIAEGGSFSNMYVAASKSYHVNEYDFLNSKTFTASFTQHFKNIGLGFSALDLQLNASREKNIQDFDDLSNHAYYGRVSIDREMLGLTWSVGVSIIKSHFDSPFFDGFEKRRDRYVSYEFGVERKISDKMHVNLDFNQGENRSNLALFESDYRAANISLSYNY